MNLALLALRLVVGVLFIGHGAQKLFGAFGGSGLEGTAEGFERMGLRPGEAHAVAAGCAELGGGLLLALGLLTPLGSAAIVAVMTMAVVTVHARNGLWNSNKGFEYNLVLVAAVFALAGVGPGAWSLDAAFGWDLAGAGWALAALAAGLLGAIGALLGTRGWEHAHRDHGAGGRGAWRGPGGGSGAPRPHAR
jgi:putative oxidoreductase